MRRAVMVLGTALTLIPAVRAEQSHTPSAPELCLMQTFEGAAPHDGFAADVALEGDRLFCTCPQPDSRWGACIFERAGRQWLSRGVITRDDGGAAGFVSMAVDGNTLVSGSPSELLEDGRRIGAALVFEFDGQRWHQTARLLPSDRRELTEFGESVAVSGKRVVVGARRFNQVYVFEKDDLGQWRETARLRTIEATRQWDMEFGNAVAIDGDRIVVGAHRRWPRGQPWRAGAVYVFDRAADGSWKESWELVQDVPQPVEAALGFSVAVQGDTVVAGAPAYWWTTGAVFVFERKADGSWTQVARLLQEPFRMGSVLGWSVAIDGDLIVAGAYADDERAQASGAALVFARQADGVWRQAGKLYASPPRRQEYFGTAVALSGNLAAVVTRPNFEPPPSPPARVAIFAVGPDRNANGVMDPCECPGDINHDWTVDQLDLGILLSHWRATVPVGGLGDLNGDGRVDQADLGVLLAHWGAVCP